MNDLNDSQNQKSIQVYFFGDISYSPFDLKSFSLQDQDTGILWP